MARTHTVFALVCISIVILALPLLAQGSTRYHLTGLGYIGYDELERNSTGFALNNSGQVAGSSTKTGAMGEFAFRLSSGVMTELPTLSGYDWSWARDINESGYVVGRSTNSVDGEATLWRPGYAPRDLGALTGDTSSFASGINNSSKIVGKSEHWSGGVLTGHAVLWTSLTTIVDLGDLPGGVDSSSAGDINNSDWVVGAGFTDAGPEAMLWRDGLGMIGLGVLPGFRYSGAHAINDSGVIVGDSGFIDSSDPYASHAFIWDQVAGMRDLGTLEGGHEFRAYGIDSSSQVVGQYRIASSDQRGFVWTSTGGMVDLSGLTDLGGWSYVVAQDINDNGEICGWGINALGDREAILLTPYVIPEPGSLLALGSGFLALAGIIRKRR